MTAHHPTTAEVDLYTWMQDLHAFGAEKDDDDNRVDPRPVQLHPAARAVAFCIGSHWNTKERKAWPSIELIAFESEVALSTVKRSIKALEAAGWLLVTHRPKPQCNIYRLSSPLEAARRATAPGTAHHEPLNGSSSAIERPTMSHELRKEPRTRTTKLEKISPDARAGADSATTTDELIELPTTWKPNRTHRKVVEEKRLSLEWLVVDFRRRMDGEKRADWDKTFGAFILATIEGRVDTTFPVPADDVDLFAPSTSSVVDLGPDPTAQALDWIAPALWAEGLHPDALTADERAEVVLSHDPGVDPRDVASRIRANRVVSQVAKHVGPMSADEVAHVVDGVAHGYDDVSTLALDIRNARRGKALMIRAGDDPAGKDVGRLAAIWLECAEEDGEPIPGDPLDRYRSPIPA